MFRMFVKYTFPETKSKSFWNFTIPNMGVSKNMGTPKSSILIGFSIINHPFWGTPNFWKHPHGVIVSSSTTHFHKGTSGKLLNPVRVCFVWRCFFQNRPAELIKIQAILPMWKPKQFQMAGVFVYDKGMQPAKLHVYTNKQNQPTKQTNPTHPPTTHQPNQNKKITQHTPFIHGFFVLQQNATSFNFNAGRSSTLDGSSVQLWEKGMELMRLQAEGCHGTQLGAMDVFLGDGWFFLGGWMEATTRLFFEMGRTKSQTSNELRRV